MALKFVTRTSYFNEFNSICVENLAKVINGLTIKLIIWNQ